MMLIDLIDFAKKLSDPTPYVMSTSYTIYSKSNVRKCIKNSLILWWLQQQHCLIAINCTDSTWP